MSILRAAAACVVFVLAGCDHNCCVPDAPDQEATEAPPNQYRGLPLAWIPRAAPPERLSGDLSAPQWKTAAALTLTDPLGKNNPPYSTEARVFCTDQALYIAFRCEDPKPGEVVTGKGEIWTRDEVEIFIEPWQDTVQRPYHHIGIDAGGAAVCKRHHLYPRYFRMDFPDEKWSPKLEIATARSEKSGPQGWSGWTCEVRIPLDQLVMGADGRLPRTLWRLNLCRARPDRDTDKGMQWSWAPLHSNAFNSPSRFGYALPEVCSSPAVIREALRTAAAPVDVSVARAADPAVRAEVAAEITKIHTHPLDDVPANMTRLKQLAYEGQALYDYIDAQASEAERSPEVRAARSWMTLLEFQYRLDRDRPDDDPPPAALLEKVAQFEPRSYADGSGRTLPYRLLKPLGYNPHERYPLLVVLHGSGSLGNDNVRQMFGLAKFYLADNVRQKYPSFVLAPHCPYDNPWADRSSNPESAQVVRASSNYRMAEKPGLTTRLLLELISSLQAEFPNIDRERLYITGESLGGFGTWECIMRRPDWFAAAMPVCGGGDETRAQLAATTPLWIFHGAKDASVNVEASRNMVKALKALGANPRYTEFPEGPHNLGQPGVAPEALEWMFAQRRTVSAATQ